MFKIVEKRRAWWPVIFGGVTEEGRVVENKIEMRFLLPSEDEFADVLKRMRDLDTGSGDAALGAAGSPAAVIEKPSVAYAAIVGLIADDWRGVGAENGEPLRFEPDNVVKLMNVPNVFMGVIDAYKKCRAAAPETRSGN